MGKEQLRSLRMSVIVNMDVHKAERTELLCALSALRLRWWCLFVLIAVLIAVSVIDLVVGREVVGAIAKMVMLLLSIHLTVSMFDTVREMKLTQKKLDVFERLLLLAEGFIEVIPYVDRVLEGVFEKEEEVRLMLSLSTFYVVYQKLNRVLEADSVGH
ncbi:hypothetical protein AB4254_12160 [Vibrio breoganii]